MNNVKKIENGAREAKPVAAIGESLSKYAYTFTALLILSLRKRRDDTQQPRIVAHFFIIIKFISRSNIRCLRTTRFYGLLRAT